MYIAGIGRTVLELLSFKESESESESESPYLKKFLEILARFTENDLTTDKSQFPNIKLRFYKPCTI